MYAYYFKLLNNYCANHIIYPIYLLLNLFNTTDHFCFMCLLSP